MIPPTLVLVAALGLSRPPTSVASRTKPTRPLSPATALRRALPAESVAGVGARAEGDFLGRMHAAYEALLERSTLGVVATQASLMRVAGDRTAQAISIAHGSQAAVHPEHTLAMALIGLVVSGVGGALWLQHLEQFVGPTRGALDVVRKAALDFTCWAPLANVAYLIGVPLLSGAALDAAAANAQAQFVPTMGLELTMFVPYNLLAFSVVPPSLRPATGQVACLIFSVLIAMRC